MYHLGRPVAFNGYGHQRANARAFRIRPQAQRVTKNGAVLFETRQAVLHRRSGHAQLFRERDDGGARVVAK